MQKYDVYYCEFGTNLGSEQSGLRPCVILQNDKGNKYSPTTIVAPITSAMKKKLPTHYELRLEFVHGTILLEQLRTIDKSRLIKYCGSIEDWQLQKKIDKLVKISLGLD
mgnify:FL=1